MKKKYDQARITISLPDHETKNIIEQAAESDGRNTSNWVWRVVRAELIRLGFLDPKSGQ